MRGANLAWKIEYTDFAKRQLRKLDRNTARRVLDYMDGVERLDSPRQRGKPLTADKAGLWRYRVGMRRVTCDIQYSAFRVLVTKVERRDKD